MENVIIEFSKDDIDFKSLMFELYGEHIEEEFIESNKFNGDLVACIISVIIPITVPFLAVAYDKSLDFHKKDKDNKKKVKFIKDGNEIVFENYDIEELEDLLKENLKQLELNDK